MKSKEAIRNECIDKKWPLGVKGFQDTRNRLAKLSTWGVEYKMMDEYAREVAINYRNWIKQSQWKERDDGTWFNYKGQINFLELENEEQLFNQFLSQQSK